MSIHQKVFAISICLFLLLAVIEMIRRRRLKEEYSWLWLTSVVVIMILIFNFDWVMALSRLVGAEDPITTIFILGFIFLLFINLDYSVRISAYKEQIKELNHQVGINSREIEELKDLNK